MTLGHEDEEGDTKWHPYWYAKVLGIFHVDVRLLGCMETEHVEFLWVHWFGRDLDHEGGFDTRRHHRIGLTDSEDLTSHGFLNPSDVLRAVHLIPAFSPNIMDQGADDDGAEPQFYYVSMCAIPESSFLAQKLTGTQVCRSRYVHAIRRWWDWTQSVTPQRA